MSIRYLVFAGICLCVARYVYAVDLTLVLGETSDAAIDETVRKIRTKCYLAEDYYFLRRLAGAQMKSITSTTGGIWKVTNTQLRTVQNACKGTLKANCSQVRTDFGISVSTLTIYNLQRPLYSGLVMSLFILNLEIPIPVQKSEQSYFWVNNINSHGSTNVFIDFANKLEQRNDCASAQIDLVFVIDSSGSVDANNFEKTKTFLNNIVTNMDINPEETRVAVIRYSNEPFIAFGLGTHRTKASVKNAISRIDYDAGGTKTDLALDVARTIVFSNERQKAAAKVLVLVTDGMSDVEQKTIEAAKKLKNDGVVIFTIGVVNPKKSELIAAASKPSCTHFINLKDYNEIGFIVREIESYSCKAPTVVPEVAQLLNNNIPKTNETKQQVLQVTNTTQSTLSTIVLVKVQCGLVTVFASFTSSYPNEADYDYKTFASDYQPGKLFLSKKSILDKLALTVLSQKRFDLNSSACDKPSYNISIKPTVLTVVPEVAQLLSNTIPKTNETKQQVLQVTNTTQSTLGTTILVGVQCGVVTVFASFKNKYPNEDDYDYKAFATDDLPGKLFLVKESELDKLALTVLSQKRFDLNSSACEKPSYNISIKPTAPRFETACLVKDVRSPCTARQLASGCYNSPPVVGEVTKLFNNSIPSDDVVQEQVFKISNSTYSSGSTIMVSAQCAEVTVYGAFNNSYPTEDDHDYRTSATDENPGRIFAVRKSETDQLTLAVFSKIRRDLKSTACDHPSYTVSIKPKDPKREVVCHRKEDERPCTTEESDAKCNVATAATMTDNAVTNQLYMNTWIYAGLLLAWRMI